MVNNEFIAFVAKPTMTAGRVPPSIAAKTVPTLSRYSGMFARLRSLAKADVSRFIPIQEMISIIVLGNAFFNAPEYDRSIICPFALR